MATVTARARQRMNSLLLGQTQVCLFAVFLQALFCPFIRQLNQRTRPCHRSQVFGEVLSRGHLCVCSRNVCPLSSSCRADSRVILTDTSLSSGDSSSTAVVALVDWQVSMPFFKSDSVHMPSRLQSINHKLLHSYRRC